MQAIWMVFEFLCFSGSDIYRLLSPILPIPQPSHVQFLVQHQAQAFVRTHPYPYP